MTKTVSERVKEIVARDLGIVDEKRLTPETRFDDPDIDADSLDRTELIMSLEDEFDIDIPDDDADKIQTVGDAITYIEGRAK